MIERETVNSLRARGDPEPCPPSGESHGERDRAHSSYDQRLVRRTGDEKVLMTNLGNSNTNKCTGPEEQTAKTIKEEEKIEKN